MNEPGVERLNRYVNLPTEWETDAGSGLDFMLCEALSFGAVERNFDKARQAIQFFNTGGRTWPKSESRLPGSLAQRRLPVGAGVPVRVRRGPARVGFWANDHIHLMGWNPRPLTNPRRVHLM